eukprot:CAMPEP_0178945746 /NCGR_PEP_ID=MMETSP0789-20121207/3902_1 /TAXON_ID=3005 /ORGANISM="Rhizosolenia setigera, Strain CCMP 1694" /LENGTH=373 /DNA_ID=CAMNT_0020625663 /DNA_START=60 /DNA_END=1181 /DNA_ORIENTATION=+
MKATGFLIMFMSLFVITRLPALASTTTESIATTIGATETSITQVTSGLATATASTYNTPSIMQPRPLGSFKLIPTLEEIEFAFRLIFASCIGASIGRERSTTHRHAGVRTMALVSLGACAFTLCSLYGFLPEINKMSEFFPTATNYVKVDPSRMASSVASGVGFIGAGVITNNKRSDGENSVRGLTTAAAIWVAAAIGVTSGCGLYFISCTAALTTISVLRCGYLTKTSRKRRFSNMKKKSTKKSSLLMSSFDNINSKEDVINLKSSPTSSPPSYLDEEDANPRNFHASSSMLLDVADLQSTDNPILQTQRVIQLDSEKKTNASTRTKTKKDLANDESKKFQEVLQGDIESELIELSRHKISNSTDGEATFYP